MVSAPVPPGAGPRPRTLVWIVADDLGWGDAGCYAPDSRVPTPALDRLAAEGLRLTDARTPSALCTPSRYAMLTGRAHWRTGSPRPLVDPYGPPLIDGDTPTVASVLRGAGYRTAAVGKWHLGMRYPSVHGGWTQNEADVDFDRPVAGGPTAVGFDRFFGTAGCSTSDPPYAYLQGDRFPVRPTLRTPRDLASLPGVLPGAMVPGWDIRAVDDQLVDHATGGLERHAAESTGPPLFLYVALSAPHNPFEPPDELRGVSGDGPRGDMAAWFDRSVGRVLGALDRLGLAADALVVVTSDHGPQYEVGADGHRPAGPFRGRKNTVWEGGLRVPFWVRWPGRVPAGAVSAAPWIHTDALPTLAALAGAEVPRGPDGRPGPIDGVDRSHAWLGGSVAPRGPALYECGGADHRIGGWAVIDGPWKLIVDVDAQGREGPGRLYDLHDDPGETRDRSGDGEEPRAVLRRLDRVLRADLADAGWTSLADPPPAAG